MNRNIKRSLFVLHKYLGLITGIIVFIVSITGACWAFKDEIEGAYEDFKQVEEGQKDRLSPSVIKEKVSHSQEQVK